MSEQTGSRPRVLRQRRYLRRHRYEIVEDGVNVTEIALISRARYKVRFESISQNPVEVAVSSKPLFCAALGLVGLTLVLEVARLVGEHLPPVVTDLLGSVGCRGRSRLRILTHPICRLWRKVLTGEPVGAHEGQAFQIGVGPIRGRSSTPETGISKANVLGVHAWHYGTRSHREARSAKEQKRHH